MNKSTTLIIPGYQGSGKRHWQTWMEKRIPDARRVEQNWDEPILARWAENIRRAIDESGESIWLIAHSFGCLAAIAAASDRLNKVAGLMLVAPANPDLFTPGGVRLEDDTASFGSVRDLLPGTDLPFPSILIASKNDPWLSYTKARVLAGQWGSHLVTLESAGHINIASGYGTWHEGLQIFKNFQKNLNSETQMKISQDGTLGVISRGRGGYVARIRHLTRRHFGY